VAALAAALLISAIIEVGQAQAAPARYAPTPIASDRVNGVGRSTLIVGDVVYVGGTFTAVTAPNGQTIASRSNLAAFELSTGRLITSFRADTNGTVHALATDGQHLYVGGSFTQVANQNRSRLARLNLATGQVDPAFTVNPTSHVYSLAFGGGRLYVAGAFSWIGGQNRTRVAAVDPATNSVVPGFNTVLDATVNAVTAVPDGSRIYIGGSFTTVNGSPGRRLVALDGLTGQAAGPTFSNVGGPAVDFALSPDSRYLGAALSGGGVNQGAWYDTVTGERLFNQRCDGNGQAIELVADSLFTGFHDDCEGVPGIRLTSNNVRLGGARDTDFMPTFDRFWGVWDIDAVPGALVVAGDFTRVSGIDVSGFAIFPGTAPNVPSVEIGGFREGAEWAFNDRGVDLGSAWRAPAFDDSGWSQGVAEFGYGDGDEATVVSFGPSSSQKYVTTYFRRTVDLPVVPDEVDLWMLVDDGAVVYVNGVEAARDNMPAGPITWSTLAASTRFGVAETVFRPFPLDPALFVAGRNVIAVEVHQDSRSSSDKSFDARLVALAPMTSTATTSTTTTTVLTTTTTTTTTTVPTTTTSTTTTTTVPTTTTTTTVPTGALFTDRFERADGPGWGSEWTTTAANGSIAVEGGTGLMTNANVSGASARAVLSGVSLPPDHDLTFSYRWNSGAAAAYLSVFTRGDGGWLNAYRPRNGYGIEIASHLRAVPLLRMVNGVTTSIGTSQAVEPGGGVNRVRLSVQGTTIRYRIWPDGQPEPTTWAVTATDGSVTSGGQVHLSLVRSSSSVEAKSVYIDDVEVVPGAP
jgi:hypothetical protein